MHFTLLKGRHFDKLSVAKRCSRNAVGSAHRDPGTLQEYRSLFGDKHFGRYHYSVVAHVYAVQARRWRP